MADAFETDGSLQTSASAQSDATPQKEESSKTDDGVSGNSIPVQRTDDSETDSQKRGNSERQQEAENEEILHLFCRLHLKDRLNNKLRTADVLQLTKHSLDSPEYCAEKDLIQTFIQKLLMMDYRARYIRTNEQDHTQKRDNELNEEDADFLLEMSMKSEETSQAERIHPMDVQMAVFYCADSFLKQLMVTKLSQCQFALPLLVPDPFTQEIEFPLWTFRQINKSWKIKDFNKESVSKSLSNPFWKEKTPMVFFFRVGSVSSSKSQLMNNLINDKHNTFFHRNCPGSSKTRVLMDGVVEIAWYCPSGKDTDKFTQCVAFCNLHGDAGDHEKQLQILTDMASVNVVILSKPNNNNKSMAKVNQLYKDSKPLICLFTEDSSTSIMPRHLKYKIGLKNRMPDVPEDLKRSINNSLSESFSFRLEDMSDHSNIRVDEHDNDSSKGKIAAQRIIGLMENQELTKIKESFLPCQGDLWHQWCEQNKKLHRPQGDEIETEISSRQIEMKKIRQKQHTSNISEFMKLFIKEIDLQRDQIMFFLKWFGILLDEYTRNKLFTLHQEYDEVWSEVVKLNENSKKSEQLKTEHSKLEKKSEELQAATFGLEHIIREIGQIYESCKSENKNKEGLPCGFPDLPGIAADMMISGFPLELMDGDAAHVPVDWVSAVLDELTQKLGDKRVFVLSVLGIQSSGKSTMLNAMFGLQFAVSAGRCTRGAFMQLVKVSDEMKKLFDYILVVDTEGLRALELAERATRHHDNELATFVVGLGNLTLINIYGENPSELQDILQIVVQAFMRMKKVKLNPSCVFVHQNVSDITAHEKNKEARRLLQKTLDEMTKLAAKDEVSDAECFSDIINFDIQKDVKYFAQLWEGSPPMAPPNPSYCDNIHELKKFLLLNASKSEGLRLTHLKDRINDLWEALLNERFVFSFKNSLEIATYRKLETEYSKWSWSLRSAMLEIENKFHNNIENEAINEVKEADLEIELKKTRNVVEKSMLKLFEKDKDKDILVQWKVSFVLKIKDLHENIVKETTRKLNYILQQREIKKNIDDQRKHHENNLYEKSIKLASKLKDKENDEETLMKEFDSFWGECVKKIVHDSPPIKDLNIMRDVRQILNDIYKSAPVDHWKENNIFDASSFSDYVKVKKSGGLTGALTNVYKKTVEKLGYILSNEDERNIKTLVTDVAETADTMIQSFNISKTGYNISCIQQVTDHIRKMVKEYEEGPVRYLFKKQFSVDFVLSVCKRAETTFTDQHTRFKNANDPVSYLEKKREEYYSIFQKYCYGATSTAIFSEIICQKLKEPVELSVYKKKARDLTREVKDNCESLKGSRLNLEKHILKTLAEETNFGKYMNYIDAPKEHFKGFIRDEVQHYITENLNCIVSSLRENVLVLQKKIIKAACKATEHVQSNSGNVDLWVKTFTQELSDVLIFSEKDLSGVKQDDMDDFNLLEDMIKKDLPDILSTISSDFKPNTFEKLDCKFKPDEILIDHFCQCCWAQCPFCGAVCTKTVHNHDGDHSVPFHRVIGLKGWHYNTTKYLSADFCTTLVASTIHFRASEKYFPYKKYRTAGGVYAKWSINPDFSQMPYWKWFVFKFKGDLEKKHKKIFEKQHLIDNVWSKLSQKDAIDSLEKYFKGAIGDPEKC